MEPLEPTFSDTIQEAIDHLGLASRKVALAITQGIDSADDDLLHGTHAIIRGAMDVLAGVEGKR